MRRVRNKNTQEVRSLKTRAKVNMERLELIKQDIEIRGEFDHPNIAKLHEAFEDHRSVYLVSELCQGRSCSIASSRLAASQRRRRLRSCSRCCRPRRVCHRDLTMDSFFFAGPRPVEKSVLKLVDFGSETKFEPGQVLSTKVGTS
jgi:calcium-dependent protein kinase